MRWFDCDNWEGVKVDWYWVILNEKCIFRSYHAVTEAPLSLVHPFCIPDVIYKWPVGQLYIHVPQKLLIRPWYCNIILFCSALQLPWICICIYVCIHVCVCICILEYNEKRQTGWFLNLCTLCSCMASVIVFASNCFVSILVFVFLFVFYLYLGKEQMEKEKLEFLHTHCNCLGSLTPPACPRPSAKTQ